MNLLLYAKGGTSLNLELHRGTSTQKIITHNQAFEIKDTETDHLADGEEEVKDTEVVGWSNGTKSNKRNKKNKVRDTSN